MQWCRRPWPRLPPARSPDFPSRSEWSRHAPRRTFQATQQRSGSGASISATSGVPLLQAGCDAFGVLLMALKDLQAGLQKAFQFRIARIGNKRGVKRAIDRLVVGDFVGDIRLVEFRALQLAEFGE